MNNKILNKMNITFTAISENEAFARSVVACFSLYLNPSLAEINDIKTAVSEAVTNCIVHAYDKNNGEITIDCFIENNKIHIAVIDKGKGIADINKAIEPFYSSKEEDERAGMGFTIMQSFMDELKIESKENKGTKVYMVKSIVKNS